MRTITKNIFKILFISLMFSFSACSSDDDNPNDDNEEVTGEDHTYDITLEGDNETIVLSGSILNLPDGNNYIVNSIYGLNDAEEDQINMNLLLADNSINENIIGEFILNNNRQALLPLADPAENDDNPTRLVISPAGSIDLYESASGTLDFSNVRLGVSSIGTGMASYTLNFEGDFIGPDDDIYQGSGTIVVHPIEGFAYD